MAEFKTNVMRMLDKAKVNYKHYTYAETDAISGIEVATVLKQNPLQVFKTLVTVGKSGQHYVFLIPVEKELDLKKASHAVGEKSVEMLHVLIAYAGCDSLNILVGLTKKNLCLLHACLLDSILKCHSGLLLDILGKIWL